VRMPCRSMAQVGNGFGMSTECGDHRAQFSGWYLGGCILASVSFFVGVGDVPEVDVFDELVEG